MVLKRLQCAGIAQALYAHEQESGHEVLTEDNISILYFSTTQQQPFRAYHWITTSMLLSLQKPKNRSELRVSPRHVRHCITWGASLPIAVCSFCRIHTLVNAMRLK